MKVLDKHIAVICTNPDTERMPTLAHWHSGSFLKVSGSAGPAINNTAAASRHGLGRMPKAVPVRGRWHAPERAQSSGAVSPLTAARLLIHWPVWGQLALWWRHTHTHSSNDLPIRSTQFATAEGEKQHFSHLAKLIGRTCVLTRNT